MESLHGTSLAVYIGLVVIFMGFAAYMTGQAVAVTWRPYRQAIGYGCLLGCAARFLVYALFDGDLLSPGIVVDIAVMIAIALLAYRIHSVAKRVSQYPWLYQRRGLWNYRKIPSIDE